MKHLSDLFDQDPQGRRFADVTRHPESPWQAAIRFFQQPDRQTRMLDSEVHHLRPALAGVIREFETQPDIESFLSQKDSHDTVRFRQAIGVLVRLIMESHGWKTTGRKGSLGTRVKVAPGTADPGAYRNSSGLSVWFTRAEHYEKASPEAHTA